jgi:hypothetical protein
VLRDRDTASRYLTRLRVAHTSPDAPAVDVQAKLFGRTGLPRPATTQAARLNQQHAAPQRQPLIAGPTSGGHWTASSLPDLPVAQHATWHRPAQSG